MCADIYDCKFVMVKVLLNRLTVNERLGHGSFFRNTLYLLILFACPCRVGYSESWDFPVYKSTSDC